MSVSSTLKSLKSLAGFNVTNLFDDPDTPDQPSLPDPIGRPETGGPDDRRGLRGKRRGTGRAGTVKAGDLIPRDIGYKSLLG